MRLKVIEENGGRYVVPGVFNFSEASVDVHFEDARIGSISKNSFGNWILTFDQECENAQRPYKVFANSDEFYILRSAYIVMD